MSSSLRGNIMSEAADNWLRQLVHDSRNTNGEERARHAKDALAKGTFNNTNLCHVYWKAQFGASEEIPLTKPNEHEDVFNIWLEAVDSLHILHKKEHSSVHVNEWLILAYYRLIRCYNECASSFTLRGLEETTTKGLHRASTLRELKAKMAEELPKFTEWEEDLDANSPSNEYHTLRYLDAIWKPASNDRKAFGGLYNKPPQEYIGLMKNEYRLYQSRKNEGEIFDLNNLEGNTLLSFFSNDANFWATSLLDRLEAIAPVSKKSDDDGKRFQNESDYVKCWQQCRKSEAQENDNFDQYRIHAQKFSMLMELLFDLKDKNPELKEERPSIRLREYAELAHLHCIIAVLPEERKEWEKKFKHEDDKNTRKQWTDLRATNGNVREFLQASASERYEGMIDEEKDLGLALAAVARWLAHRTNGFYVALASNVQQGELVTDKTSRKKQSSSWGEKVVLKHNSTYYQFISAQYVDDVEVLERGLDDANRFFNQRDQTIEAIKISRVCFGALEIEFPQINGQLLSEEWERAWKDKNMGALVKLFGAIVDFFLRHVDSPHQNALNDSVCLPRLDLHKGVKDRLMKAQGSKEETQVPLYLTDWIHGDEWGENFTVVHNATETRLYGIDLEDGLKRGSFDLKTKRYHVTPNGGFHAQRLFQLDITENFEQGVPRGAFNGLSAVGRLLAAMVQKSNSRAKKHALENIQTLKEVLKKHEDESMEDSSISLEKEAYHVVWLSFFDWLLHWTDKDDDDGLPKFNKASFDAHLDAFVNNSDA